MKQQLRLPWRRKQPTPAYPLLTDCQSDQVMADSKQEMDELTRQLGQAIAQGQTADQLFLIEQLRQLRHFQRVIAQITLPIDNLTPEPVALAPAVEPAPEPSPQLQLPLEPPRYVIDEMTLRDYQTYLLRGQPEHMHAVTGAHINGLYLLSRMVEIEADVETWGGVTANPDSVAMALMELDRYGLGLYALFHSHRMRGIQQPSSVDWAQMKVLDAGDYPTIQGIVSEDGYWTFFSGKRPFEIEIIGKGVNQIEQHIFQVIDDNADND